MNIWFKTDNQDVDFQAVADILDEAGLSHYDAQTEEIIFSRSYAVVYVYDGNRLIGCGRALSDGICQAAIYNIALAGEYQGHQLGRAIIEKLLEQVEGCTTILYTHPKTVAFYERLGFRREKTGFVHYPQTISGEKLAWFEDTGFLLPENYRYSIDESELYDSRGQPKEGAAARCRNPQT